MSANDPFPGEDVRVNDTGHAEFCRSGDTGRVGSVIIVSGQCRLVFVNTGDQDHPHMVVMPLPGYSGGPIPKEMRLPE